MHRMTNENEREKRHGVKSVFYTAMLRNDAQAQLPNEAAFRRGETPKYSARKKNKRKRKSNACAFVIQVKCNLLALVMFFFPNYE